jgi:hypothetical protein
MNKTAAEVLIAARALIADPKRWTRDVFARNERGTPELAIGPEACCWCSVGALMKCGYGTGQVLRAEVALLSEMAGCPSVAAFNDSHEHHEVLAAFDRAIAKAGAQ